MRTVTELFHSRPGLGFFASTLALLFGANASAQQTGNSNNEADRVVEEVVVTGVRRTIQDSIGLKRTSIEIVDGLNADEIGELPALSIGEALETITAAASHRENGGATEVSIRGMGPYLGTTVVNGREATNGGGNRAVNFSIFPTEMFNKIAIHKTQSASYVEGAVSGQIHLDTKRPIEYGKQSIQFSLKGSGHPDDGDISGQSEYGYRGTASYINSWETSAGVFGVSLGVQKRDDSNPEQEATVTSGGGRFEGCLLDSFSNTALPVDTSGRCHDGSAGVTNDDIQGIIDNDPNINSVADIPWAYIPRSRTFRQNVTDDEREAIFGAVQWQPNDRVDILVDFQASERDQKELRNDLLFGATQNNITELYSDPRTGILGSVTTETDIASVTTDFSRLEKYEGAGFNVAWQATDTLGVAFDAAFSDTKRTETDVEVRMGANEVLVSDADSVGSREDFLVNFTAWPPGTEGLGLPTVLCTDADFPNCDPAGLGTFDITDPRYFSGRDRARIRARQIIREMTVDAYRLDFTWDTNALGAINTILFGVRDTSLEYRTYGGNRGDDGFSLFEDEDLDGIPGGTSNTPESRAAVFNAANNCGQSSFPQSGFLSRSRGGNNLLTVANGIGNGNGWATFNHGCLLDELLVNYGGRSAIGFENGVQTDSVDLAEDTLAFYVQANYESEIGGRGIRGNFGVRVVDTDVTSVGYRLPLSVVEGTNTAGDPEFFIVEAPSGTPFETTVQTNSYTEVLPSVTFIMDLADDLIFRAGAFKGISRPDPHSYSNARNIPSDDTGLSQDGGYASLEEAVRGISAGGNPQLESLPSLNLDFGLEWYANEDTMLAGGLYWKEFQGGYENVFQAESFDIDGNLIPGFVRTTQVSGEKSTLTGFEVTLTHSFDYLPGFLSGFGAKLGYNYADSDFKFEDGYGGDSIAFDADGNVTQLIGIVPPAGLNGLSRHTSSAQVYWQNDRFSVSLFHKMRSRYLQQFTRDADARLRYTNTNQQLELRMNYDVTDNIKTSFEVLNLLSEPRIDYRPVLYSVSQTLEYGPRMFFGVRAKF